MLPRLALCALPPLLSACVPPHAAYLSVPLVSRDGSDVERAVVWVPLAELAARMDDFDANSIAFYIEGRTPLPYRAVDVDGDQVTDFAAVAVPVRGDGSTRLIAVSPGPLAQGEGPTGQPTPGIELRFDQARD